MSDGCRNRWKKGAFLIIDSESGMTRYSDKVTKDYTEEMVTKRWADSEQPQDFIKPSDDPRPIPFSNPGLQDFTLPDLTSTDRYWVGHKSNWNAFPQNWAPISGGVGGSSVPTAVNDVFIDTLAGGPITVTVVGAARDLDFTGYHGSITAGSGLNISGSLTMGSSMTNSIAGVINLISTSMGNTLTSNGVSFSSSVVFNGVGGGWTFADNFTLLSGSGGNIQLTNGALNDGGKDITIATSFSSNNSNIRSLTMTGVWIFNGGTGTIWNTSTSTNMTLTATGSLIKLTDNSTAHTFVGGGLTYYNFYLNTNAGTLTFTGSNTFNNIKIDPNNTVKFTAGTTTTLTGSTPLTATGTSGNLITIASATASNFNIVSANNITTDYITISRCQFSGGGTWHAGANSVDGGNNSGITFP